MRPLTLRTAIVAVALAQACGGAPLASKPALVAPLPAPQRAQWVLSLPAVYRGSLDLGSDLGVLWVGMHGRRTVIKPDGTSVEAPTLALGSLVGALRVDSRFAFVADNGDGLHE